MPANESSPKILKSAILNWGGRVLPQMIRKASIIPFSWQTGMTHLERLVLTLTLIFISLAMGYFCKFRAAKWGIPDEKLLVLRKRLQTWAIFGLIPFSAMLSLWGLPAPETELLTLPFLGLVAYLWGGFLAIAIAKLMRLSAAETGSFYCCGTFTNLGAVGGLVCLMFLGESSIALVALYRLLEEIYYFSVSFPIARKYAKASKRNTSRQPVFQPVLAAIITALALGGALNYFSVRRPEIFGAVASCSMLLATIFFLFSIGLSLRVSSIGKYLAPSLAMCAIKFIFVPIIIILLAIWLGYAKFDNSLALKVVAILSCMPVAMTALVPPTLFDLDVDLANSCWITSTIGLVAVLPGLLLLLPFLSAIQ